MARGHFVGLFLRGIAQQVTGTGAAMVGELGARLERGAWQELVRFPLHRRTLGQWRAEATKPSRLWDGGSVSGRMKSVAAWLAPQAAKSPDSSGSYLNGSAGSSLFNLSGLVWVR